jgi:hypothetical protein
MAIDITAAGQVGTHSLRKVNVNTEDNYIYFSGVGANVAPAGITDGASYIYTSGIGSIGGITEGELVYASFENERALKLLDDEEAEISFTSATPGGTSFNFPIIYDNILNINSPSASNQAIKYYTTGTPLTGLTSGETYFLKTVPATFTGTTALYEITDDTHTFTTCGQTGRQGPNASQIALGYSTNWHGTYIRQGDFRGYQDWTVPVSGVYRFDVRGASGFEGSGAGTAGRGARIRGEVALTKGEIITIAVGQRGAAPESGGVYGGSGGGTFVVRKISGQPLIVAGGGSADAGPTNGRDGATTTSGSTSTNGALGGQNGNGGSAQDLSRSAGGGGFFSRGEDSTFSERGGGSFLDGLEAASNLARIGGDGGFGGGGSSDGENSGQSGGGGGFSGGSGARSTVANQAGGGGGSFVATTVQNLATSNGSYNNSTNFNGQQITNLNSYNTGEGSVVMTIVSTFTSGNEIYPTAVDADAGTNKIEIEPAGNSFHAIVPINLDTDNNVIHSAAPHTLTNGEAVVFSFNEAEPLGIQNGTIYYINTINAYTYRISSTQGPGFTTINLTQPSAREVGTNSTLSRVVVNTATNTLTINNHGFLVDQPLRYSAGGGTPIAPLQDGVRYYVSEVVNANQIRLKVSLNAPTSINFTSAGTGTSHSFLFVTVDPADDSLYIPNHGLVSGQLIRYIKGEGNVVIPGLTDNTLYYVLRVDNSIIKLTTDSALQNVVNITNPTPWPATGTQQLVITALDFANDTITVPSHGFAQGELVEYDSRGQTEVAGLSSGTPYYVIVVNSDNIKLATTPQNAIDGVAVDISDSPAGVGRHSLRSLTKTPDGTYTINAVPSPTTFTVQAPGNVPIIEKTFDPRASIDLIRNVIFLPSHGFLTGTKVTYSQGDAATDIGGLTDDTEYFIVTVNKDYIRLATTAGNAASGITIPLTGFGTGVGHSLTATQINGNVTGGGSVSVEAGSVLVDGVGTQFSKVLKVGDRFRLYPDNVTTAITFADTDINTVTNIITKAHDFTTGDTVKFLTGGGVAPSPLVNGYYYFVRAVSSTEITLHNSEADALADTGAVDFNTTGDGNAFTLTETVPTSPIIRKITAVGSDTQITVDRPYADAYTAVSYSFPTFIYVRPEGYALHRPFDGGAEMSVGTGTWYGQMIRQTRKYFRYQSGKGIQTSAGINFKPSIDLESMVKEDDTTVLCTTRRPHGLISGLFINVSQAEDSFGDPSQVYNGEFQVIVPDVEDPNALTQFRIEQNMTGQQDRAYGFPQFFVREWTGGATRSGMFDFQNGMFYEFDGQKLYAVRRSSTQQMAGTAAALQGSELIFGTGTQFTAQLDVGDFVVLRGQTYRVVDIDSDTRMAVRPEYKGASGTEKEFNPQTVVNTSTDTFNIVGHGFSNLLPVEYNSIDGEPIGGLINGRTYYISLINNNSFRLLASPDAENPVSLSSTGTTTIHSFVPAKSGIVITKTVDTRVPQEDWSIDPCDGSGPTGYNLDLSRIQMIYMDYSWYGAGKIRFGFKTADGQVQYVHEFVHNNQLYESYFRSGNLPARYEVNTYENPTYIPFLFHWGTSVMMDGRFDDDNAYLFTAGSQTLNVAGTTPKSFSSAGIDLNTDLVTVLEHGFRTGDVLQFQSIAADGFPGPDSQNPGTEIVGSQTLPNLTNSAKYKAFVNSPNRIHLTPEDAKITVGATFSRSGSTVTVVTAQAHGIPNGANVGVYFIQDAEGDPITGLPSFFVGTVTVTNTTTFTFQVSGSATVSSTPVPTAAIAEVLNFTSRGNTQYTYFLYPDGSLGNTSGPNYQPLISLRLSPSVSEGLTGALGDRDVINRMQLRLQEVGISSNELVDVKMLLNPRLNNLNFVGVDSPALTQIVEHTAADTVSGGVQVYNFRASGGGAETTVDVEELFELSNSILGGDSIFPDGPDIITIAVSRLTGNDTRTSAKLSWTEAQA